MFLGRDCARARSRQFQRIVDPSFVISPTDRHIWLRAHLPDQTGLLQFVGPGVHFRGTQAWSSAWLVPLKF